MCGFGLGLPPKCIVIKLSLDNTALDCMLQEWLKSQTCPSNNPLNNSNIQIILTSKLIALLNNSKADQKT